MKKIDLALLFIDSITILGIAALLGTGHSGFATKVVNILFFCLAIQVVYNFYKS